MNHFNYFIKLKTNTLRIELNFLSRLLNKFFLVVLAIAVVSMVLVLQISRQYGVFVVMVPNLEGFGPLLVAFKFYHDIIIVYIQF